ncbi:MAG: hypothetical protein RPS47_05220 [Colwellia sp.]
MNLDQLRKSLKHAFLGENHRLFFWFDIVQKSSFLSFPLMKNEAVEKVKILGIYQ